MHAYDVLAQALIRNVQEDAFDNETIPLDAKVPFAVCLAVERILRKEAAARYMLFGELSHLI